MPLSDDQREQGFSVSQRETENKHSFNRVFISTNISNWRVELDVQVRHGAKDRGEALDRVAVYHRPVLQALVEREARAVDDPTLQRESKLIHSEIRVSMGVCVIWNEQGK